MKSKLLLPVSVLLAVVLFGSWTWRLSEDKNSYIIRLLLEGLKSSHYDPLDVDDSFSEETFDTYLERLDYYKRFLIQEDIEQLTAYRHQLDDQARVGDFTFFDLSAELIAKRIKEADAYYQKPLKKPFDFSLEENYNTDAKKRSYAAGKEALKERWRKMMKYETLHRLHRKVKAQADKLKKEELKESEKKTFAAFEAEAREEVQEQYEKAFKRFARMEPRDWRKSYFNAFTTVFDPHTGYFPPKEKQDFDISMSGRLEGIGATLSETEEGLIKVVSVVPGGPASKQGDLEADFLITAVAQGDQKPVDVTAMRLDDAIKLIRGKKGTKVRLTVRKPDQSTQAITIIRDVVQLEATYAKSALIKEADSKATYGYIHLPRFYFDANRSGGRSCSRDIGIELEKLKAQEVQGVVLDLRNNGGGSLWDVVKIGGFFIEKGPIVQVKSRNRKPQVLSDPDEGIVYDGPLVVLVNNNSASASEIMAAAMQDYKRAVIIGSPSTFGKGTVQRFFNLDNMVKGAEEYKPLGSIKLTLQKFYRINGGATQRRGVIPDVIAPDTYSYLETGEKQRAHVMPWDEIEPVAFKSWVSTGTFHKRAIEKSQKRIAQNPTFKLIDQNAQRYKKQRDDREHSLSFDIYQADKLKEKEEADKYKHIMKDPIPGFEASNLEEDLVSINAEKSRVNANEKWLKKLKKDIYLYEGIQVLKDL